MTKSIPVAALSILLVGALACGCKKKDDAASGGAEGGAATDPASAPAGDSLGGGFEGALTMHMTSPHRAVADDITFLSKGDKLRFDAPPSHHGEHTHVIFESATKQMLVVLDAQKSYMELDLPKAIAATPQAAGKVPSTPPTVTKTGKHEKIAGYDCEDWDIKDSNGKQAQACIAEGVSFIDFASIGPGAAAAGSPSAWLDELHGKKLFPLRAIDFDAAGKESSRMEVTKIEKKKLDDSLFAIPAGYKKIEMPHFGGGMPGMPGGFPGAIPQPQHK
jgi:hypothetical protein